MIVIRTLVADDQALVRGPLRQILGRTDDIEVVGEALDGQEAVALVRALLPDVVLMDIRMPILDGIAATEQICSDPALAATRVLVFTTFDDDDNVAAALRAGASGFVGKASDPADIANAVRTIHAGDALLSPKATRGLISRYLGATAPVPPAVSTLDDPLTRREEEILTMVAHGMSNEGIAGDLHISPHTVRTHIQRIMTKCSARDRAQLVVWAYRSGHMSSAHGMDHR
ncbi:response regulator [Leifsonia sp. NPDC058194]|uniref:response regulator transcription factor n=1 Tax=Leifsonia sp. NPDC058194 TaxID=3346374 RepID=UPI0036DCED15